MTRGAIVKTLLAALFTVLFSLSAAAESLYVKQTNDGFLNLREGPGVLYRVIKRMYPGDRVYGLESSGTWRKIEHGGGGDPLHTGWASSKFLEHRLTFGQTLTVKHTSDGYLNLRAGPGSKYNIIRRMYPGDDLRLLDAKGEWRRVELQNGVIGWAHARYLQD